MYSTAEKQVLALTNKTQLEPKDVSHLTANKRRMLYLRDLLVLSSIAIPSFLLIDVLARLIITPILIIFKLKTQQNMKIYSPVSGKEIEVDTALAAELRIKDLYFVLYENFASFGLSVLWIGLSAIAYLMIPAIKIYALVSLIFACFHLAGVWIYKRQRR